MPFSAESAQARPFMVEGFLATLQRIDERCGSLCVLKGASLYLYSLKSAQQNLSSSLTSVCATGYVGYILGDRLHTMHKATCGIHADMRLVSDTPLLPFLGLVRFKGRAHGPCSSWSFRAQVKVASTIEPPRPVIPAFSSF